MISLKPVKSAQIAAIGHDAATNTLAIQFVSHSTKPGSIYHYGGFSAEKFAEFEAAESKGRYFGANIKGKGEEHPFTRQADPE